MDDNFRKRLSISPKQLDAINKFLLDPNSEAINNILKVIHKYGEPEEINLKAKVAGTLSSLFGKVRAANPLYIKDLEWLIRKTEDDSFISIEDYRKKILGQTTDDIPYNQENAVTLEISALQYFPWLITMANKALNKGMLIPARFIQVRKMKEQELDGDLPAIAAAMKIIGASFVETLDTKGTDGSNIHLCGPETITGYFGGIGQPNHYALKWLDEFLYYYTNYGIRQVLNINPGSVLLSYLIHKMGIDIEFKISVFMGNDNPYSALWTLLTAVLFSRDDGSCPLVGFNWSNSVNNQTLEIASQIRSRLGLEELVRFEHHITETYKSIVRQPYNQREALLEIADHVPNISAKHEGGDPEIDCEREHPSDILDYFRDKEEVIKSGDWEHLETNFMDKFESCNLTASSLTENGLSFIAARNLHKTKNVSLVTV